LSRRTRSRPRSIDDVSGADTLAGRNGAISVPTLTSEYPERISTVPDCTTGRGIRATTTPLMFIRSWRTAQPRRNR
jgi:hypothetical protein